MMQYLSKEIEALAKKKSQKTEKSLVKKETSCGIFQDCGIDPHYENFEKNIDNLFSDEQ